MRVTEIELDIASGIDQILFSFRDPSRQQRFNVVSVSGLDADNITPRFYGGGQNPNTGLMQNFYNLALEKRDVAIKIQLNPDFSTGETPSYLRDILYRAISASRTGKLDILFKNEGVTVALLTGWIVKLESNLFDKDPYVTLTIKTEDPFLKAPNLTTIEDDDLDTELIGDGGLPTPNKYALNLTIDDAVSTAPHGFMLELTIDQVIGGITIGESDDEANVSLGLDVIFAFQVNDVLHFSSLQDDKQLYVARTWVDPEAGPITDIYQLGDTIVSGSIWPILFPGLNTISFSQGNKITLDSVSYYPTFWGI